MNEIEIYKSSDNKIELQVNLDNETVWLTQQQMSLLFSQTKQNISLHINNCFKESELESSSTVKEFLTVQKEGNRSVNRKVKYYNLDVIISVGYRVKSKQGTAFRQWATQKLKEILVQGYSINQKRLDELQQTIQLIKKSIDSETNLSEAKGLLEIITNYTQSFVLLNQYDSNHIEQTKLNENVTYEINYPEAKTTIAELKIHLKKKKEATDLFGNEKDQSFEGILKSIVQTFGAQYLYPSNERHAA